MQLLSPKNSSQLIERLWDVWCIASLVGIWPRFIEPSLLTVSRLTIPLPMLPKELEGLKIVQFSDLHYSPHMEKKFLEKVRRRIMQQKGDIIVFTGDLLSYSELVDTDILKEFLQSLSAPLGCYAIFGNHDYSEYVSLASDGVVRKVTQHLPAIMRGFARLFSFKDESSLSPEVLSPVAESRGLRELYTKAGFSVLHNETIQIGRGYQQINLTGLGDVMAHQCDPDSAFARYNPLFTGIVLSHNPDSFAQLKNYPGDLILCGHTHGGQINIPYLWKRVTAIKNQLFKSGLFHIASKFIYVNRGVGSPFPFRWFAPPEISCFTLVRHGPAQEAVWQRLFPQEVSQDAVYGTSKALYKTSRGKTS